MEDVPRNEQKVPTKCLGFESLGHDCLVNWIFFLSWVLFSLNDTTRLEDNSPTFPFFSKESLNIFSDK